MSKTASTFIQNQSKELIEQFQDPYNSIIHNYHSRGFHIKKRSRHSIPWFHLPYGHAEYALHL